MQEMTRNRIKLAFLLLAIFIPITLASFAYRSASGAGGFAGFGSSVNKGNLILPPADVTDLDMRDASGQPVLERFEDVVARLPDPSDYNSRPWAIVYLNSGACESACRDRVHLLRQMHVTLGKNMDRVSRYYLNTTDNDIPQETLEYLQQEFPGLDIAYANARGIQQRMASHGVDLDIRNGMIFFVDPVGNVMMYYDDSHPIEDIKSDLDRLLKYSSLG